MSRRLCTRLSTSFKLQEREKGGEETSESFIGRRWAWHVVVGIIPTSCGQKGCSFPPCPAMIFIAMLISKPRLSFRAL